MSGEAAPQNAVLDSYKLAKSAQTQGDLAAARAHLESALAQAPGLPPDWLKLLEAEILRAEGRKAEACALWKRMRVSHPDNHWPAFHLADQARKGGDLAAARAYLEAALRRDAAKKNAWIRLLEADLLRDEGHVEDAKAALERAVEVFPANIWFHQRLAQIAEEREDLGAATRHLEAALKIDDSQVNLHLAVVRFLTIEGQTEAVVRRLEALHARFGDDMRILMALAGAYKKIGNAEREQACLTEAIATDALHPGLLRHLFITRARSIVLEELVSVADQLRPRVGNGLADELLISSQLQMMQFQEVLRAIRRNRKARRSAPEARSLTTALFGAHHYELGLRYLRLCLRRWPQHEGLWSTYVTQGLKLGRLDEVSRRLDEGAGRLPVAVILPNRFMLCGFRNDLDGAVAFYERLQELGLDTPAHRTVLGKLVYVQQDPETADVLFARIGNPGSEDTRLLHRGGLVGMMTLEFDLERRALQDTGGYGSPADWVRARPGSTIAAIRLVDAWNAKQGRETPVTSVTAPVPRQIFQYWDNPDPPSSLAPMTASWATTPGFDHRLMNRIDALRFLREAMGGEWVRAFQLAQNAAQEADLLRLCLLWRRGGVWADADDCLYGDLDQVLGHGRGLILYREPLGGALANNFMGAPPGHPVVAYAARLARQALLQRANENAWNKTGPGLLTRAVAQYLVQAGAVEARHRITVLDWPTVAHQISTHNPVTYKISETYWNRAETRTTKDPVWNRFRETIGAREIPTTP